MHLKTVSHLNEKQREAVLSGDGPVLVLAGAGSGKTRVIAHRIAHLLKDRGEPPFSILAVTFTNKAANEMKERVLRLLERDNVPFLWIGTFHAISARILREDIDKLNLGLTKHFTIFDRDDSKSLVRKLLKEEQFSEEQYSPSEVVEFFSFMKRGGSKSRKNPQLVSLFELYQKRLVESNACDFDDLLLYALRLLKEVDGVRTKYRERFKHVLVDEYQDTNDVQEEFLTILSGKWQNLFLVGDEDQSIYSFRGSRVRHIVDVPQRYHNVKIVRLEQNYRSFDAILRASSALVAHNTERLGKTLWTDKKGGDKIAFFSAPTDREEANFVTDSIREYVQNYSYGQIAVLMRTNAQSRTFEEAFLNKRIPYQIVGGLKFYERKEIKDILAYIRLALNPYDRVSLLRIINTPTRGIGKTTIEELERAAFAGNITLFEALERGLKEKTLTPRAAAALSGFMTLYRRTAECVKEKKPSDAVLWLLDEISYEQFIESQDDPGSDSRIENLGQLVSALKEFEEREHGGFEEFLERQALQNDQDELNGDKGVSDSVKVMTIHSAKGLEFPVVFIVGIEDSYFPHDLSKGNEDEIEEERRLLYVGMTRAMEKLVLTNSRTRYIYGSLIQRDPSPFIAEIPREHLRMVGGMAPKKQHVGWHNFRETVEDRHMAGNEAIYKPGARVHHKTYGVGVVLSTEGTGDNLKVNVSFSRFGRKKLLASVAKLDIL